MTSTPQTDILHALYDLSQLGPMREASLRADPAAPGAWVRLAPVAARAPRSLGVLAGSFNPPTLAHLALADAALREAGLDEVAMTISKITVDKEAVTRASLPDRLVLLSTIIARLNSAAVLPGRHTLFSAALVNRGLYLDQALAIRATLPRLEDLRFIVGFDKIVQILDPRYYLDRFAALDSLFDLATFLVAPREGYGPESLDLLMASDENRRYSGRVSSLSLPPTYAAQSSTNVRAMAEAAADLPGYLPPEVVTFIDEAMPYTPPWQRADGIQIDPYGLRLQVLDHVFAAHSTLSPDQVRQMYTAAVEHGTPPPDL